MRIFYIGLAAILLISCGPRRTALPSPTQIPAVDSPAVATTPEPQSDRIISLVTKDLTIRLSLDPQRIHLISAEPIRWPDTALGCPRPGEGYAQQTVAGYQVRLEANGREYDYHTDEEEVIVLCTEDGLPSFPITPDEIDDGQPWMPVD